MKSVVAALHFLTRIRTSSTTLRESDMGFSLLWYPIVGVVVGLLCGGAYHFGFRHLWPGGVSHLLLLGLLVWLKDAFHLDGLSDLVDGLYGGETPDDVYSIMKDSALGPFGALAMLSLVAVEYAVLLALPPERVLPVLTVVLALSTAASALLICWGRPIKGTRGLASFLMRQKRPWFGPFLMLLMLAVSLIVLGLAGLLLFAVGLMATLSLSYWFRQRLGGINGDCCGAAIMVVQGLLFLVVSTVQTLGLLPLTGVFVT